MLILPAPPALGADPLTWEACAAEARKTNPEILQARAGLAAEKERRAQAWGSFFPRLEAEASAARTGQWPAEEIPSTDFGTRLSLSQTLLPLVNERSALSRSGAGLRKAEARLRKAEVEARKDLREAFIGVQIRQEEISLRQDLLARREENTALVRKKAADKKEDASSVQAAEAASAKMALDLNAAKRGLARARRRLALQMGRAGSLEEEVSGNLEASPPPAEASDAGILSALPGVQEAQAELESARAERASQRAPFWPGLFAEASWNGERDPDTGRIPNRWNLGLSARYEFSLGLTDLHQLKASKHEMEESEASLLQARKEALERLEETLTPYQDAYDAVAVSKQSAEAAKARALDGRRDYENGDMEFDTWNEVENTLVDAQTEYLEAREQALETQGEWEQAIGTGFPTLPDSPPSQEPR